MRVMPPYFSSSASHSQLLLQKYRSPFIFIIHTSIYVCTKIVSSRCGSSQKKRSTEVMIESLHGFHVLIGLPTIITPPLPRFCFVPPFAFARRPSQQPLAFTRLEWFLHEKRNLLLLLQLCYHMGCRILQGPKSGICVENWPNQWSKSLEKVQYG